MEMIKFKIIFKLNYIIIKIYIINYIYICYFELRNIVIIKDNVESLFSEFSLKIFSWTI